MSQAEPGMTLAMPVFHPENPRTVLLRAGAELERRGVDRLREMRIPEIWIRYPKLELISRFVSPGVATARAEMSGEVCNAFEAVGKSAHAKLDFPAYRAAMGGLVQKLICDNDSAIFVGELVDAGRPAMRHGANVGFIALLMGLRLGFYMLRERSRVSAANAKDVTNLGVAAMLHDIGMTRLPEPVLKRWRATRDENDPEWRQHVRIGFEMVRGNIEPSAASSVLHHHHRYDGSGFPTRRTLQGDVEPFKGSAIHIYARIIAAADMYDRLVNPASDPGDNPEQRPGTPPVAALHRLVAGADKGKIDPIVLRALLAVCPAYAPGTMVRLSNGVRAVVTDWSAHDPCRPVVHELSHFEDEELGDRIELARETSLVIAEVDGFDTRPYNFYPTSPTEFDLVHAEKAMMNSAVGQEPDGTDLKSVAA